MKICSIVGARPQFIKEAIIQKILKNKTGIEEILIHTGQHFDSNMSGAFFEALDMKSATYNLDIHGLTHGAMTGKMMVELENIIMKEKPDLILLYGDTNSTLAGAIVGAKLKIPVAHIEAGLRQEPKDIPEEINRVLTDRISDYLFVPSAYGMKNLEKEGLIQNAFLVGDVMYDIFLTMKNRFNESLLQTLNLKKGQYITMTLHRDFNVDDPKKLEKILLQSNQISKEIPVVLPLHPRTKNMIEKNNFWSVCDNMILTDPIGYLELMGLTQHAHSVITDSGGYQKEAYFSGKTALVIMKDTSWRELVDEKINYLVTEDNLYSTFSTCDDKKEFKSGIYGDGHAAEKIVEILEKDFM